MTAYSVNQVLALYTWFPLSILLLFLLLIARFYQRFSDQMTRFKILLIPILLFGASSVRYASIDVAAGDLAGDVLSALAGVFLVVFSIYLAVLMLVRKSSPHEKS